MGTYARQMRRDKERKAYSRRRLLYRIQSDIQLMSAHMEYVNDCADNMEPEEAVSTLIGLSTQPERYKAFKVLMAHFQRSIEKTDQVISAARTLANHTDREELPGEAKAAHDIITEYDESDE